MPRCGGFTDVDVAPAVPDAVAVDLVGTTGAGDIRLSICCMLVGTLD